MPIYDTVLDEASTNTSHAMMLDLVGRDRTVLDVGCATGYLARALVAQGCRVSGVEVEAAAAEEARPVLDRLIVGDLNTLDLRDALDGACFDVVVLGDVLEHLADPHRLLAQVKSVLAPGGAVVISIPNVAHGSVRLALLQGRWRYRSRGLLDETHLRFVTRASLHAMLGQAGLVAVDQRETLRDPLDCEVEVDPSDLPPGALDWVRRQHDAWVYQFVWRAVRDDEDGRLSALAAERADLAERLRRVEGELRSVSAERDEARASLDTVVGTTTWRALEPVRRAYGRLRHGASRA